MSLTVDIPVSPLLRVGSGLLVSVSVLRLRIHFFGYYPILRKEIGGDERT